MFDTDHYLHYVLDTRDDCHFTEELLQLSPQAYLWHRLRKYHGFQNVVFVTMGEEGPALQVYDSGSEQLLRPVKKGWFSSGKKDREDEGRIGLRQLLPSQLKQQTGSLLLWLLERQKSAKSEPTALVFSPEALRSLYEKADKKGRECLEKYIRNGMRDGILILHLRKEPRALAEAFLEGQCWLPDLDPAVAAALRGYSARPLLTALEEQLRDRLVDLSGCQDELWHMLLREALDVSLGLDSPEQLQDQHRYLQLCCRSGQGVMEGAELPLRRSAVYGRLCTPEIRTALREQTAQLRNLDAGASMEELFLRRYGRIPTEEPQPVWEDTLAITVGSLTLPRDYLEKNRGQLRVLTGLNKAVQTLWNRRRNPLVSRMVLTVCDAVRQAGDSGDYDTVTDGMTLLNLCAGQLCADPVLDDNLTAIFEIGEELLHTSAAYYAQRDTLDRNSVDELELYRVSKHQLSLQLGNEAILEAKHRRIETLRSSLNQAILYFDENPRSDRVEQLVRKGLQDWKDRLEQAKEDTDLAGHQDDALTDSAYDL